MKFLKIILPFFFFLFVIAVQPADAACLRINGVLRISGGTWPAGGTVTLRCLGDTNPGPSACTGGQGTFSPGDSFDFQSCSCLASNCLQVVSMPPGCTEQAVNHCGQNGQTVTADVTVSCGKAFVPACDAPCLDDFSCLGAKDGCYICDRTSKTCVKPTFPPAPACNTDCGSDLDCAAVQDTCTKCGGGGKCVPPPAACGDSCLGNPNRCANSVTGCTVCNPTTNQCEAPPTTGVPACNTPCNNPSACLGAQDGCTACVSGSCQQPPLCKGNCIVSDANACGGSSRPAGCNCVADPSSPTGGTCSNQPPPAACNTPCNNPSACQGAKDGCTFCNPNSNSCTTPPPFKATCKCDSLTYSTITAGGSVKVTAFGRVEGANTAIEKISSFDFQLMSNVKGSINVAPPTKQNVNATQILNTPTLARYQAIWDVTIPKDTTKEYRIQAVPKCDRKLTQAGNDPNELVLVKKVNRNQSLLGKVMGFVDKVLGTSSYISGTAYAQKQNIQLETFIPATTITSDNCSFIKFSF